LFRTLQQGKVVTLTLKGSSTDDDDAVDNQTMADAG
jgi:hypothetical protein